MENVPSTKFTRRENEKYINLNKLFKLDESIICWKSLNLSKRFKISVFWKLGGFVIFFI